jgi:uncharacterized cupredoxin-like copper-binding protein
MRFVVAGLTVASIVVGSGFALAGPGERGHSHVTFNAGEPGNPKKPFRTIVIIGREDDGKMSFTPDRIEVKRGEQIKFIIRNEGELPHEFLLDSIEGNRKHAIEMQKNPEMEHDDPNGRRVEPKKETELLWRFSKAGTFEFACLIPGHYEANMKGVVTVVDAKASRKKK